MECIEFFLSKFEWDIEQMIYELMAFKSIIDSIPYSKKVFQRQSQRHTIYKEIT